MRGQAPAMQGALDLFDPVVADWFARDVGEPTAVQVAAWPALARGEHVLVTAPTGSGKTLTAFLAALDRLLTGAWPGGGVRVLYVSPLKALNSDIRRNLLGPLDALTGRLVERGSTPPAVGVEVRSGDTTQAERRKQVRTPPEILITTPESLNLLLTTRPGRALFGGLRVVILDEIHAVADDQRGTHLITAVDRLVPLAGEFQRVALSATVRPLERIAEFVGGYTFDGHEYKPRPVTIVRAPDSKAYAAQVVYPGASGRPGPGEHWPRLAAALEPPILANRSTLVFVNSRRSAERLAWLLNQGRSEPLAYAHHGSLARETRQVVEERLKRGELRAIVATGSLELGIDIGGLDEVLLVETPPGVAQTLQRFGRAGHRVGEVSRGRFYATSGRDLLQAAVMARCVRERDIEALAPVEAPLDVLAQVLVGLCAGQTWSVDDLYDGVRCSWPYRHLARRAFDLVVEMLAGRYAQTRLQGLQPRLVFDRLSGTVTARPEAVLLVRTAGGTIPDRGYFTLRHAESRAKLGELDEEFVWERHAGDVFTLGTQAWRIEGVTQSDVLVTPARATAMAPFWRAEEQDRDTHFAARLAEFCAAAETRLTDPTWPAELAAEYVLDAAAAQALVDYLRGQRLATGTPLPHRHHLLVEQIAGQGADAEVPQVVLHTLWGGRLNRPFALALAGAWAERYGDRLPYHVDNDCVVLLPTRRVGAAELLALVEPERLEDLLAVELERSGYFGARFREAAGRALVLTRGTPARRLPLWLNRQRAKQLQESVARHADFPLLAETWRVCLRDCFDLGALRARLDELRGGALAWSETTTSAPSPFAAHVAWRHVNELMYLDDTPTAGPSRLSDELLREVVFTPHLRPELDPELCARFAARLQRTWPGYAPESAGEALELVKERLLLTRDEWQALLAGMARDHGLAASAVEQELSRKVVWLTPATGAALLVALENVPRVGAALAGSGSFTLGGLAPGRAAPRLTPADWLRLAPSEDSDPLAELLAGWLQFHGPVDADAVAAMLGLPPLAIELALDALVEAERVVVDKLTRGGAPVELCDAENLERLLRLTRRAAAPAFAPVPLADLGLFLAERFGLTQPVRRADDLPAVLGPLLGLPLGAGLLEAELLPARCVEYQTAWLDRVFTTTDLHWVGCGEREVLLAFPDQFELLPAPSAPGELPLPASGRHRFEELLGDGDSAALARALWAAAWRGAASNDTWAALRQGLASDFAPSSAASGDSVRRAAQRWRASRPFAGHWFALPSASAPLDEVEALERDKERVRLLVERWGVLSRVLLAREAPLLRWAPLFRALRLMELSGELVCGLFFDGLGGPQFTSPEVLARLRRPLPREAVYWLNATDPAALCGLGLPLDLPERRATTWLVYEGARLVLVVRRRGRELEFRVPPDAPRLDAYLGVLEALQQRPVETLRGICVEEINGVAAHASEYRPALAARFQLMTGAGHLKLWRR